MSMRLVVDDNQQVEKGSGRTSLYLLLATLIFLTLMALALMTPRAARAEVHKYDLRPGTELAGVPAHYLT